MVLVIFEIGAHVAPVNVLAYVLGDVAGRGAPLWINCNDCNAVFRGARFAAILTEPVIATQRLKTGEICGRSEYDKMPMHGAVVMRLGDSEAVYA